MTIALWILGSFVGVAAYVMIGGVHCNLMRYTCTARRCNSWKGGECVHAVFGGLGYVLWPIFMPVTVGWTLSQGHFQGWVNEGLARHKLEKQRAKDAEIERMEREAAARERLAKSREAFPGKFDLDKGQPVDQ